MSASANTQALAGAYEGWNAGNLDAYLELYDEGIKLHGYTPEPMTKAAVRGFYQEIFAAFDNPKLQFHDILELGDKITIRFTMIGTHVGPFMGVPATQRKIALDGITILQFRGGKCIERWSSADMLGLLIQIGAVPAPPPR